MPKLTLKTPTDQIFMIGPAYASRLKKLNIFTAENLLHHYPVRYLDRSLVTKISKVQEGASVTVRGQVVSAANLVTPRGKKIQKVKLEDDSGTIEATWFNQHYLTQTLTLSKNSKNYPYHSFISTLTSSKRRRKCPFSLFG